MRPGRCSAQGEGDPGPSGSTSVQRLSALTISPPALVAIALQVARLTLSLTNRTEPSSIPTLTPPEWYELAPTIVPTDQMTVAEYALLFDC